MTFNELLDEINTSVLTLDQLTALNKLIILKFKNVKRTNQVVSAQKSDIKIGDIVRFDAKTRGFKTIKVQTWNRAGTCVVGFEVDNDGVQIIGKAKWTVSAGICKKV